MCLLFARPVSACDARKEPKPFRLRLGPGVLYPSGFFESIGMYRTATTGDSVSTRFGRLPLRSTPGESLVSAGHSRMQACGQVGNASGYVETDFLNNPGNTPFRFRQYWGEYRIGKWRILAGQAWSLLRPNRAGITSEGGLMNTLVTDPAYEVGLAGVRNRQVRITREEGSWRFAVSYEAGKNFLGKIARDRGRMQVEVTGLGSRHRAAGSVAAVLHAPRQIDIVSQQVFSHGAGPELLNTIPAGVNAYSTIQGIEVRARRTLELFAYGGATYGARSAGNRVVREWTVGFIQALFEQPPWGAATLSGQLSQVDRATWSLQHGDMTYFQVSFRYSLPGSRSLFGNYPRSVATPGRVREL